MTVTASLISYNEITSTDGGGLENYGRATFIDSSIDHNKAFDGPGGVYNDKGSLTFIRSVIQANTSTYGPTGIDNYGHITLRDSTVYTNTISNSRAITATNSTLSAVEIENSGRIVFGNATIANAGLAIKNSGTVEMGNTILASNHSDCEGPIVSRGHNLVGNATGCGYTSAAGDLVGTSAKPIDPRLGPLQLNGGTTPTHALLTGSPAIDAGDNATCTPADQRGVARPQGAACDIGAVEMVQYKYVYLPLLRN